jgi:hypothetical protein
MSKAVSKADAAKAAQDAWKGDSTYQATRGALQAQLGEYGRNLVSQGNRYDEQFGKDLGNLGLQQPSGARYTTPDAGSYTWAPPVAAKTGDGFIGKGLVAPKAAPAGTAWNTIDGSTASGKAFTDQGNDYAARGMMQSSGFNTDHANLGQNFTNQLNDAVQARQNYQDDLTAQGHAYIGQSSDNLNQARLSAIAAWNAQNQTNAVRQAAGIGGK